MLADSDARLPARARDRMFALAVTLLSGALVAPLLHIGWVPSDEGTLAASARRVLEGQWPHRDFTEIYSGGLSLWHAVALRCFGTNLFSLRLAVFLAFLAWVPCVYRIARRWLTPRWAAVATLGAVGWSLPNYVAAMPSWYNLFFATWGTAAVLRFIETRRRRWMVLAGAAAGASIAVKVTGLYFVAAVLLFLVFFEQEQQGIGYRRTGLPSRLSTPVYSATLAAAFAAFLGCLAGLLRPQMHSGELYAFFLPPALCVLLLVARETRCEARSSLSRFGTLLEAGAPFVAGLAAVILAFVLPLLTRGEADSVWVGITASVRAHSAGLAGRMVEPSALYAVYAILPATLLAAAARLRSAPRAIWFWAAVSVLSYVLVCSVILPRLQDTWMMAGLLPPLLVLDGGVQLLQGRAPSRSAEKRMLLLAVAALCPLVQFPVSYVTYFCYAAPLVLLAGIAIACPRAGLPGKPLAAVLLVFFSLFGWAAVVTRHVYNPDIHFDALHRLSLPQAGVLRVDEASVFYEDLVPFLEAHSPNGLLYAGNDCPQLYFLTGLHNPTRDDTGAPAGDVLRALRSGDLRLVVFNDQPFFAGARIDDTLRSEVARTLPQSRAFGPFTVYWK